MPIVTTYTVSTQHDLIAAMAAIYTSSAVAAGPYTVVISGSLTVVGNLIGRPDEIPLKIGKADFALVSLFHEADEFAFVRDDFHKCERASVMRGISPIWR